MIDDLRAKVSRLYSLLEETRDCVAESLDAARAARLPRPKSIEYFENLLSSVDKALKEV